MRRQCGKDEEVRKTEEREMMPGRLDRGVKTKKGIEVLWQCESECLSEPYRTKLFCVQLRTERK